jgi:hypothetical protein
MDLSGVNTKIFKHFIDNWSFTGSKIVLPNEKHDAPKTDWVRLSLSVDTGRQISLAPAGFRKYEYKGTFFIEVFTLLTKGSKICSEQADFAVNLFEGKYFQNPEIMFIGSSVSLREDERYFAALAKLDFNHYLNK